MAKPRLLLLAVAYANRTEVRDFCATINNLFDPDLVHVAVCDNSPEGNRDFDFGSTVVTARPDNPGYWDGALAALEEYSRFNSELPDWVAITNTDLNFAGEDLLHVLSSHASVNPLVIAPRITEGLLEKNPHLLDSRPRWRLLVNHLLTYSTSAALLYLVASRLRLHASGKSVGRGQSFTQSGSQMFAPYGALMIFNAPFVEREPLWPHVPLLAEEWAVAQMAIERHAVVIYEPRIWVRHSAHQTTGGKISLRRAAMLSRAFKFIWENR